MVQVLAPGNVWKTDSADKVLVLTEGQWAEKGCITITQIAGSNEL